MDHQLSGFRGPQAIWFSEGPKQKLFVDSASSRISNWSTRLPTFEPWREKHWDLHRRINNRWESVSNQATGRLEPSQVTKAVLEFARVYGDFFDPDGCENIASYLSYLRYGGSRYNRYWVQEWDDIKWALTLIDAGQNTILMDEKHPRSKEGSAILNWKLQQFSVPDLRKKRKLSSSWSIGLIPTCLAGFVWILIARDALDGVIYKPCKGFDKCGREVPSRTPTGKATKYCSDRCKQRAKYEKKLSVR